MVNEALKTLHYKRGSCKTQQTLFVQHVAAISKLGTFEDRINLEQRIQGFMENFSKFQSIQEEIDVFPDNGEKPEDLAKFQDEYYLYLSKAKALLITSCEDDAATHHSSSQSESNSLPIATNHVKLPQINMPTFDGELFSWMEFHDNFLALVDVRSDLSESEKLFYLKMALKGEAKSAIASLKTTNANYAIAWSLLKKRYHNKRRIVRSHVKAITDLQPMQRESREHLSNIIDTAQSHVKGLEALGENVGELDILLVPILETKIDPMTRKEWETSLNADDQAEDKLPTFEEFINFLNKKRNTLDSMIIKTHQEQSHSKKVNSKTFVSTDPICAFCDGSHNTHTCEILLNASVNDRIEKVKSKRLCLNCLKKGHFNNDCKSTFTCRVCFKRHHSILHIAKKPINDNNDVQPNISVTGNASTLSCMNKQVILPTALVYVIGKNQNRIPTRAALDSCSQSNFITRDHFKKLDATMFEVNTVICGITNETDQVSSATKLTVQSRTSKYNFAATFLIRNQITTNLPNQSFSVSNLSIPANITLADPNFNCSGKIDMLLGAEQFFGLLCVGQIQLGENAPILQKTKLGWILAGHLSQSQLSTATSLISLEALNDELSRFWTIEEVLQPNTNKSKSEQYCERHYEENTTRNADGTFVVRIPFKTKCPNLGTNVMVAEKRLKCLESRFKTDSNFEMLYKDFMSEYAALNHMSPSTNSIQLSYFMPHHGVLKESSSTTKLRVVFDGSCKSDSGISLNDSQFVGPTIQRDLFSILSRFRTHKYALTADISKMYRRILVHPEDRIYQQILWRNHPDDAMKSYTLNTITYGTAAAPYLAIRTLFELAKQSSSEYPRESEIIMNDFYVDDLITGCNTVEELHSIKRNLLHIMNTANLPLRKWCSNLQGLFQDSKTSTTNFEFISDDSDSVKVLGIQWLPSSDSFSYQISSDDFLDQSVTRRSVLSLTAKIFDPLGLLSPILVIPKLILQSTWVEGLSWDESLPENLFSQWISFINSLKTLHTISIPRHIVAESTILMEYHGFADASERAYGACIYLRCISSEGAKSSTLIASKSRVAPVKSISLPRLELCAALLLARLTYKVKKTLNLNIAKEYLWSDSTIVLCWIKQCPSKLKTFVRNRTSEIQQLTSSSTWNHVRGIENPADLISRGTTSSTLQQSSLWWHGPNWLLGDLPDQSEFIMPEVIPEQITMSVTTSNPELFIFERYSSLTKLINVTSLVFRFCDKLRHKPTNIGIVTTEERERALHALIAQSQQQHFQREIKCLETNSQLKPTSSLLQLNPILIHNLLRVGGRLRNSEFSYNSKHPIILAHDHALTTLIFRHEHNRLHHVGAQTLLNHIRQTYWPIRGKALARKVCRNCVVCFRFKPRHITPIMGDLPETRVRESPPFWTTGVDYAGPFNYRERRARGHKIFKCYVSLFICLATKGIHLELVTELTTDVFMAALRRFIARRGKPAKLVSDNGTNFVGANNHMKELTDFLTSHSTQICNNASQDGINWDFIPPRSPHFGGLWESNIRSMKSCLFKSISNAILTFEEFQTVLCDIEATLNSRPLCPLSDDPDDLLPLTPAHFMIGRPLTALPERDYSDVPTSRLSKYEHLQQLHRHFWKRWKHEYLTQLQSRQRWQQGRSASNLNDLVILKDDNQPPTRWRLGRVVQLHPGKDNIVRVVSVRTSTGIVKRAIRTICILPI